MCPRIDPADSLRLVFMGTPDFAVPSFYALAESETLAGVVTQPDRPKGRKGILTPPPIKTAASERQIPILQPERLKKSSEVAAFLADLNLHLIVVVAFGQILPENILKIPRYGCINVHASLLPKYRGAGPIQWAIINGETHTGITTMLMDAGMDTGPILLQEAIPIGPDETAASLSSRLSKAGAGLLLKTIGALKEGTLLPKPQDDVLASHAPLLKKEAGWVDWGETAPSIYNRWRALLPWPGLTTVYKQARWKLVSLEVGAGTGHYGKPGEIFRRSEHGLEVAAGHGYIIIKALQPEGKREMTPSEYAAGHRIDAGSILSPCKR
ncbi:MAG: methionyl-tRNA formyltransferase [Nitrospiria bacterium]